MKGEPEDITAKHTIFEAVGFDNFLGLIDNI
jgi:hypothetical protein